MHLQPKHTGQSNGSRRRMLPAMLLGASLFLTACETIRSSDVYCPAPVYNYDERTRLQAAAEYDSLPPGGLRTLADDYNATRAALRAACTGATQ